MKTILLILSFLALNLSEANAKIYKWTDANGNVHFSENKPQNTEVKEIKISKGRSTKPIVEKDNSESPTEASVEKSVEEKAIDAYNKKETEKAAKYQLKENCKIAKKNLATLQKTRRVRRIDPETGESIRMDDTQRLSALKAAKKLVSGVCR